MDIDDTELFEISVDSLRSLKDNQAVLQNNSQIIKKIEILMPKVGVSTRKIFQEILCKNKIWSLAPEGQAPLKGKKWI